MNGKVFIAKGSCPFCMAEGIAELRLDKRGNPFFKCFGCGTIAFIHSDKVAKLIKDVWFAQGVNYQKLAEKLPKEKVAPSLSAAEVSHG